jgi:hypothetical protein
MADPATVPIHGLEQEHDHDHEDEHDDVLGYDGMTSNTEDHGMEGGHHEGAGENKRKRKQCPDLDVYTKWAMVVRVIQETNRATKRLKTGSLDLLTQEFAVSKRTIQRVYTEYTSQIEQGILVPDMSSKKPDRCGADSKLTPELAENIINLRAKIKGKVTARGMADAYEAEYGYKIPYMTLYRYDRKLNGKM